MSLSWSSLLHWCLFMGFGTENMVPPSLSFPSFARRWWFCRLQFVSSWKGICMEECELNWVSMLLSIRGSSSSSTELFFRESFLRENPNIAFAIYSPGLNTIVDADAVWLDEGEDPLLIQAAGKWLLCDGDDSEKKVKSSSGRIVFDLMLEARGRRTKHIKII